MKKFVIMSQARTGSNMLVSALKHHKNIVCFNELFNNDILWGYSDKDDLGMRKDIYQIMSNTNMIYMRDYDPTGFLNKIFSHIYSKDTKAIGFKLFYTHDSNVDDPVKLWNALVEISDLKIIYLRRKSIIENYYSLKIAEMTGVWIYDKYNYYDASKVNQIIIDPRNFLFDVGKMIESEKNKMSFLKNKDSVFVWYEDMVNKWEIEIENIMNFIGVEPYVTYATNFKQNTSGMKNVVKNYDEIVDCLCSIGLEERI